MWQTPTAVRAAFPGPRAGTRAELYDELAAIEQGRPQVPRLLLAADVDGFRAYNALHGYGRGDAILDLLERRAGSVSQTFRLGADAFALLLAGDAPTLVRQLGRALDRLTLEHPEPLHCSFGVALVPTEAGGCAALALAEERLDDQKRRGLVFPDRVGELLRTLTEAHDEALGAHTREVARLADAVAARLGLSVADRGLVRRTAELHDIGKLAICRDVLSKTGPLDAQEWDEIRRHTLAGEDLLSLFPSLAPVAALVRSSHERLDGDGYPDGLDSTTIPLVARIVAVCDAYDAMVTDRTYRPTRTAADACAELEGAVGKQFDAAVVAALLAEVAGDRSSGLASDSPDDGASEDTELHRLARLHAFLESATIVEHADDLPRALEAVAQVVAESLNYGATVINLWRPEWDDFVVSTVYGDDPGLPTLLGSTYGWETWNRLLEPRFLRAGAYTVYAGEYDWTDLSGHRVVPEVEHDGHPDAWQGEDEIFIPFHHTDGHILGVFNVAQPKSGRRPSAEELHLLTTVVRHAARAVQRAQEMAAAAAHRRALEHLLQVSSKLTETASGTAVLEAVTTGISEALGFERVVVHLRDPETEALVPAAAAGLRLDDPRLRLPFGFPELQRLFDARYEREGCFLVPCEDAEAQLPELEGLYQSRRNGRGPWAWHRHWLAVPLNDPEGSCLGVIFADDPVDRLLPTTESLQALRLFANQATVALEAVAQYEAQRYLAEHDALTRLRNRHSFMAELDDRLRQSSRRAERVALVYCDLDGFKQLNDARGHSVGDDVLARFGRVLTGSVREQDTAFRIGGDEFALVLPGCSENEAKRVVERALVAWVDVQRDDPSAAAIEASFGIAVSHRGMPGTVEDLLRRADEAMYEAKRSRNRLEIAA
ncbi:MAG: diguanylate cyclase domain-containing protein [Verrucomicrobiota bacterium]